MYRRINWKWWLGLFALGLMAGVLFFSLTAKAQQDEYCKLISGETTSVIGDKNLNSGVFEFQWNSSLVPNYRSCVKMRMMETANYALELDGWVWNSNLGWTALSAYGDSAPYENSGETVGDYSFSSYVKYGANGIGQLRGWWWNDAMGWISLHCLDIAGMCSDSEYGGSVEADGDVFGYAWSDSVGWIDLDGMVIPTAEGLEIVPDVSVELVPFDQNEELDAGSTVYAGTQDTGYKLAVAFDFEGNSLIDDYTFDFDLQLKDQVMAEQVTDTGSGLVFNDPPQDIGNNNNVLLLSKLSIVNGDSFRYEEAERDGKKVYLSKYRLRSVVPTVHFKTGESLLDIVELKNFTAVKRLDDETTVVNTPINLNNIPVPFVAPINANLTQEGADSLSLNLGINKPITAVVRSVVSILVPGQHRLVVMEPEGSGYYYCFYQESDNLEECEVETDADGNTQTPVLGYDVDSQSYGGGTIKKLLNLYLQYYGDGPQQSLSEVPDGTGVYAYMEGEYAVSQANTIPVRYVTGSLLAQKFQVFAAEIKGNTRVDASRNLVEESSNLGSAGLRAENTRVDYLKYGQAITRGRKHDDAYQLECNGPDALVLSRCIVSSSDKRKVYVVQNTGSTPGGLLKVNFLPDDSAEERVVVVIGKDVEIDKNLYFKTNNKLDKNKKLVLMVFKNGQGKGGNVYVRGAVTMVQANIYADGTMFSADKTWAYDPDQLEPTRTETMRDNLRNQFVLLGSLVSQNTVGGCDLAVPRLGDGRIVPDASIGSKERACLYDLNYFRYSPMVQDTDGNLVWPSGTTYKLASQILNIAGVDDPDAEMREKVKRTSNSVGEYAIVNLEYSPPPQDANLPKLPTGFTFSN